MSNSQEPRVNPSTTAKKARPVQTKREYRQLPTSWEEASPENKMLITMRKAGGSWQIIKRKWQDMTGTEVGASSLPARYTRLVALRAHLAEGDVRGDTGNASPAESGRQTPSNRCSKEYLPSYIQTDADAGERPVREAVIRAYLDAVNEAVEEAIGDEANDVWMGERRSCGEEGPGGKRSGGWRLNIVERN